MIKKKLSPFFPPMASKFFFTSLTLLVLFCLLLVKDTSGLSIIFFFSFLSQTWEEKKEGIIHNMFCLMADYCNANKHGCFDAQAAVLKEIRNRKLVQVFFAFKDKKTSLKAMLQGSSSSRMIRDGEKSVSWELRRVPSGPDPLHHNGGIGNPKPQTP
ncbi:uncharacterized protein LOC107610379 [Arachis ipaensis]|uniref:uncharacterized protein LOC107610379 n=1 Tax=Arachis ipaensis TaxID=130454 RepID=UPI000A2B9351|nr:uncharacterized protein LOC107610379 [Arachis ipaensis]XP_025669776.1 uncharacterized protein LOC112769478 [Arachis hypogaea]